MVRRFALPFVLLSVFAGAAAADTARQVTELQLQVQTLEARLKKLEAMLQNHAAFDLLKDVEAMKAEMSRMRGQSEVQTHQMESLGKRQTDLYTDLDKRLEDLNKQVKTAVTPAVAPAPPAPVPTLSAQAATQAAASTPSPPAPAPAAAATSAPAKPATASAPAAEDPLAESKTYEAALNQFKAANYAGSIAGFKNFLKSYPGSSLASNAQYWIGYSYYALKDYKTALAQQQKLVSAYPQSAKVPDALLNIASSQLETDDTDAARKTLEEIINKHSNSNAAKIAAKRLAALK